MTNKEAIVRIKDHMIIHKMNEPRAIFISEALSMAIKVLEQESVLDKLDEIITKQIDTSNNQVECQTLRWVLDVMSEMNVAISQEPKSDWIPVNKNGDEDNGKI